MPQTQISIISYQQNFNFYKYFQETIKDVKKLAKLDFNMPRPVRQVLQALK